VVESNRFDAEPEIGDRRPVVGGGDGRRWATLGLDPSPESAPAARVWTRDLAELWDLGDLDWALLQLVTELVTNAVLHAGTRCVLRVEHEIGEATVRCSVTDYSPARPRRRVHSSGATTGRGLQMLERLSSSWGVEPSPSGKTVWFELREGAGAEGYEEDWEALADLDGGEPPIHPPTPTRTVLNLAHGSAVAAAQGLAA
jgi:anti-sigma regulatory factor (Ser/Thr protein kinase)